ncbi:MAG: membrane protein insertase YidC [Bacteroidetes bacterium]|nr:membrane protein insertase YidC [Bacteroidota bacterium]
MDKKATIGYILIFVIIFITFYINQQNVSEIEKEKTKRDTLVTDNKIKNNNQASDSLSNNQFADTTNTQKQTDTIPEKIYTISNSKLKIDISNKGAKIKEAKLVEFKTFYRKPLSLLKNNSDSLNFKIYTTEGILNTMNLTYKPISISNNKVSLEAQTKSGKVIINYELKNNSYKLNTELILKNFEKNILPNQNYIDMKWISNIVLAEQSIEDERSKTTVYFKFTTENDVDYLSETKNDDKELQKGVHWVCYKQKFFNTTLINKNGFSDKSKIDVEVPAFEDSNSIKKLTSSFILPYNFNSNEKYTFEMYIGPNKYDILSKQGIDLEDIISLGFFAWVNKIMIIPIFTMLEKNFVNMGFVILLLTLIIKLILFPLVYKSYVSSAKMKILKPEIDEIKNKYGNDMTKIQQENMKLYKRAGVSPFGGCLPMLIQLPILLAMFNFFPASIELRQKAFLWAKDLSTYDPILEFGFHIPGYGSHVSLFTLLMTISTLLYTRMNNQLTGVSGQMKWISYLMPILFLGFFNNYASGLTYYYFLANMITFGQNVVIRRFFVDEKKLHKQIEENKKKPVVMKKSSFQKKLEEMQKKNNTRMKNKK